MMKKILLFVGYIITVVSVFMLFDFSLGKLFDKYLFLKNDPVLQYAYLGGRGEGIAVLGASRASHHYVPSILEDGLGVKCYNYGMDGRNIFNQYVVADFLLADSTKKPSIIVLEIASIDICDSPGYNNEKLSNLDLLYKKSKSVREVIDLETPQKKFILQHINLFRYNSSLLGYIRVAFNNEENDKYSGYKPLSSIWEREAERPTNEETVFHPTKEVYLRKLFEKCHESEVRLFLFNSPAYYDIEESSPWENRIKEICGEYGVPFFNHANDSLFLSHREWFNEPFHLNDYGAKVYSSIVVQDINEYLSSKDGESL